MPDRYDDGGFSGGNLERPALKRLLADIEARRVDVVVVYKIDRLSRSLMDFARLVEVFDRNSVTFVSVTQSFNTTTSMGRLTLNILLSFAQFEREVIGERIRDKFAASRKQGHVDGWLGAARLRRQGPQAGGQRAGGQAGPARSSRASLKASIRRPSWSGRLAGEGVRNKQGKPIDKGYLYRLLNNRSTSARRPQGRRCIPGEHEASSSRALWDKVHAILKESPRKRAAPARGHGRRPS